jgi:hypothetical protein
VGCGFDRVGCQATVNTVMNLRVLLPSQEGCC